MAKAGWITGIVGVVLAVTFFVLIVVLSLAEIPMNFGNFPVE